MAYNPQEIEKKWRKHWAKENTFKANDFSDKPKYYVLDMFPYPSGAGLHVGHPLGYIASDIYARYKRLNGFNVLHPMGYDSFGLPAEQYAIQTGQHPAKTTEVNIARYREQLDKIGFSFDWSREVRTSDPKYYKWTQWIFKQLFNAYYDKEADAAKSIEELKNAFAENGSDGVNAHSDEHASFSAKEWQSFSEKEQEDILQKYRLAYLAESWVNWCPALGTVLANDEIKDGVSERGGHPVEQKRMQQWNMRITAYAERLLQGLDTIDWSDAIKEQQTNWIGKSKGAEVQFQVDGHDAKIDVFTTRPDTIYGVSFMVLAPEHDLVKEITTAEQKEEVDAYVIAAGRKTERERQADVKTITGAFTGAYAIHPLTDKKVPIWIGDYVLASYGFGAVMAVPAGDQRDWNFANTFGIEIPNIFEGVDISEGACDDKSVVLTNSEDLNGLAAKKAIGTAIHKIQEKGVGRGQTNYRLRDAVFSRQRYWGEPFPIYYKNGVPKALEDRELPLELPPVDQYLPTEDGEPPLARAKQKDWEEANPGKIQGDRMELNTMPGWAGSSWYFLRYMDPHNEEAFVSKEKVEYWQNVDLYFGGSEHATGHLLYARFWTKFLKDRGYINFEEPFKKLINQGMILGTSEIIYMESGSTNTFQLYNEESAIKPVSINKATTVFYSADTYKNILNSDNNPHTYIPIHVNINYVKNNRLNVSSFINERKEYADAVFVTNNGSFWHQGKLFNDDNKGGVSKDGFIDSFLTKSEVEKMSKSKFNVENPDDLVEEYGADTLRCYEMFLGPLEQYKPWDTQGMSGVYNFLKKFYRLFHDGDNCNVSDAPADKKALKVLHQTIQKVQNDLDRYAFNTVVSNMMIAVNELLELKCNSKEVLEPLTILLSPYAPHLAEELWEKLGHEAGTISHAEFPKFDESYLQEDAHEYPVSFNGKMRFKLELPTNMSKDDIEKAVLEAEQSQKWLEGKAPKKVIVVPKKIVNVVV